MRLALAASCLLTGAVACSDPAPEDSSGRGGPPSLHGRQWDASVVIDGSYPDLPPSLFVVITASGVNRALSFEAGELELLGPDGGEPLATIHGSLEPRTPSFSPAGYTGPTYFTATDLNRDLLMACDATSYRISVWTSDCRCETVLEGPINVACYPDSRSGEILAEAPSTASASLSSGRLRAT